MKKKKKLYKINKNRTELNKKYANMIYSEIF